MQKYKNTKIQKIQKGKNTSLQFLGAAHNSKNHPALPKTHFWQNAEKGFNAQTITAPAELYISINDCGGQIKQSGFYTFKQKLESEGLWPDIKWRLS